MSQLQVTGEAKIRDLQGPVVANAGVITALDGAANQYVRGDGTLASFPTSGGGGSSVSYYLNGSVNQGTFAGSTYYEMGEDAITGTGTNFSTSTDGLLAQFITDAGVPDVTEIPSGNWNVEFFMGVSASSGALASFYVEIYKWDGSTFTLIATNAATPEFLTNTTTVDAYFTSVAMPTTTLAVTDRLAIRIYANVASKTVTLYTEDNRLCQVVTTFSKGILSLNNLTDQSQYLTTGTSGTNFNIDSTGDTHTFNLPVASATNTGKLSSTDWTTFNNKQNAITDPITGTGTSTGVAYFNSGTSITSEAAFNYDASTNRLGVNTSVPNATIGANAPTDGGYSLLLKNDNANYNGIGFGTDSTYGNLISTEKQGTALTRNLTLLNQSGFVSLTEAGNLGLGLLTPNTGLDIYNGTSAYLWLHTATSGTSGTDGVRLALFNTNGANLRNFEGSFSITAEGDFSVITLGAENFRVNSADGSIYQSKVSDAMLKTVSGVLTAAVAGTDYLAPSALSAYVPYTGATADVDLGAFILSAGATSSNIVYANGSGSSSGMLYLKQGTIAANYTGYNGIYATSTSYGFIADTGSTYKLGIFSLASLTDATARTYTLPDLSGTLALTSDIPVISGSAGRVPYFTSSTALGSEAAFNYDSSTNRLGVNTTTPNATIGANAGTDSGYSLLLKNADTNYNGIGFGTDSTYGNLISTEKLGTATAKNITILNQSGFVSLTEGGNLGLNILNPAVAGAGIDIYSSTSAGLRFHTATSGTTVSDGAGINFSAANNLGITNYEAGTIDIVTNGNSGVYINSSGYVGISGATPSTALTVNGGGSFTSSVKIKSELLLEATNSINKWNLYTYTDNSFRINYNGVGNDELVITSDGIATFQNFLYSGSLIANGTSITSGANITLINNTGSSVSRFYSFGTNTSTRGGFQFIGIHSDQGNPTTFLDITTTGAATFSSSVTAASLSVIDGGLYPRITVQSTNAGSSAAGYNFADNSGVQWAIAYDKAGSGLQFFKEGSGNRFYITNGGNVGIGTSSPDRLLTIYGNHSTTTPIHKVQNAGTGDAVTEYRVTGVSWYVGIDNSDSGAFKIGQDPLGTSDRLTIADGGNTTIKGTAPILAIESNTTGNVFLRMLQAGTVVSSMFYNNATSTLTISNNNAGIQFNTSGLSAALTLASSGAATFSSSVKIESNSAAAFLYFNNTASPASNYIALGSAANEMYFQVNNSDRMVIKSNGSVGIGTAIQGGYLLTVSGNIALPNGTNREIYMGSVSNYNYRIKSDGDDFVINEAGATDRLRYSYSNGRWYITGGLTISGSLAKGSGSFKIDHPLESLSQTHNLVHSFVESPQANNIYRGKIQLVNGVGQINLDEVSTMTEGTFVALNREIHTYTSNETDWDAVRGKVEGNILTIECQNNQSNAIVYWLVIGERKDKHMMETEWTDDNGRVIVEPLKDIIK